MPRFDYDDSAWPPGGPGNVQDLRDSGQDWAGHVYLPDPDTRRGWSIYHVYREPKAKARRMGFSRRRVR